MSARKFELHNSEGGSAIAIRIIPRASRNEITEIMDDGTIKIRLTAPPVNGQINEALIKFLAEIIEIPPSRIEVIPGATGRDRLVSFVDLDSVTLQTRIINHLA